ncbi:MAG: tail fiber domain-containing protein [Pseudomonadales bacterium]|nr:tail fiber domain-containing protein [Pseudomonadales bacterium]
MPARNTSTAASRVTRNADGSFSVGSRRFANRAEFQERAPAFFRAWQRNQGNTGTVYRSQQDVPQRVSESYQRDGRQQTREGVRYRGLFYSDEQFRTQFPAQYADLQRATGNQGNIPAGQDGSPYPAALPANSFEAALDQLRRDIEDANRANDDRYQRLFRINERRQDELTDTFTGIRSRVEADNAASADDQAELARLANERIGAVDAGYQEALTLAETQGRQALSDARRAAASADARTTQDAITGGYASNTVLAALRKRNRETSGRIEQGINESIAGLRSGIAERRTGARAAAQGDAIGVASRGADVAREGRLRAADVETTFRGAMDQILADRAGFIERRMDAAPDASTIANLIMQNNAAQAAARGNSRGFLETIGGSIAGGVGTGIGTVIGGLFCDRRLKRDVEPLGQTHRGVPLYRFRYTSDAIERGLGRPGLFMGVMADELGAVRPGAVGTHATGYLLITDSEFNPRLLGE